MISESRRLKKLKRELQVTKKSALAEGTTINLLVQWRSFDHFCDKYNLHEWPVSSGTLCLFAQHLAKTMRSVKTIESYLFGVVRLHNYAQTVPPDHKEFNVKLTLRGIRRKLNHRVRQPKAFTPELLEKIYQVLDFTKVDDITFWAILLTGFFLLLRKSNLVAETQDSFDAKKQLRRDQVLLTKNYVKVTVTWSKTIQFHERKLVLKMYRLKQNKLCPVRAFKKLFAVTKPRPKQSCFLDKNGLPFSYAMVNYRIKKFLKLAGVKKYKRFSTHSLRRGGLLIGFQAGLPRKLLKVLGDWKSECFEVYLSFPKRTRDIAARVIRDKLSK